jgi:hypothetical protein
MLKYGRSKDLANYWMKQMGDKLLLKTLEEARRNFQKFIEEGNKLTYEQIKMLNTIHKGDYI